MKLKFRAEPKDILVFVIFMIFCFYIVSIGVLNALSILDDGTLHGLNPFPIFAYKDNFFLAMILFITILIIAFTGVSSYFFEREK